MKQVSSAGLIAASVVGAIGLVLAGALIGLGFYEARASRPSVMVKGLAEQFVQADIALWPLRVTATGDDLAAVQAKIDADLEALIAFLTERGIEPEAIRPQRVEVTDLLAQAYRREGAESNRFIIAQTVIVRSTNVERIATLNRETGELVRRGVVLTDNAGPTYLFTRLNEIKPAMLAEATRNARRSAEQFAADAGSTIGGIRRASQGVFQILPRDPLPGVAQTNQIEKKVRVVSTIEYFLAE